MTRAQSDDEVIVRSIAAQLEAALNDHAVCVAKAQREAGDAAKSGLQDVARALLVLAEAIRDAKRTP